MGRQSNFRGWVVVGEKTCYFKSLYEVWYARYLQMLKENQKIEGWEYESPVFYFEGIKRGVTNTKLDFTIKIKVGEEIKTQYIEVKGDWDAKSVTRVNRFKKYYPELTLIRIDNERKKREDGSWDLGFFDKLKKTFGSNHHIFSTPIIVSNPKK